jgi:hypothetical protein
VVKGAKRESMSTMMNTNGDDRYCAREFII